ncbi:hypothetical protein [Psychromonas sp.]|uniref:hypothetical protein n=1 Tax=Psychromonas sp. TaxID=1884585 RepID=UPI0039E5D93E
MTQHLITMFSLVTDMVYLVHIDGRDRLCGCDVIITSFKFALVTSKSGKITRKLADILPVSTYMLLA